MYAGFCACGYRAQSLGATSLRQKSLEGSSRKEHGKWEVTTLTDTNRKAQRLLGTKPVNQSGIRCSHWPANYFFSVQPSAPPACAAPVVAAERRGAGRLDLVAQAGSADLAGLAYSADPAARSAGLVVDLIRPVDSAAHPGWDAPTCSDVRAG